MSNRNEKICDIYRSNPSMSMGDVADKFDISRQRVHQILKSNNVNTSNRSYSPDFDKQDIRDAVKKFYENEGHTPTCREWTESDYSPSVTTIFNRYGSWDKLIDDTNLPRNNRGNKKEYSSDEMINILSEAYSKVSDHLTQQDYQDMADDKNWPHFQTIIREFGKWSTAVSKAI
jgi:lipoate-protein ligase A